MTIEERLKDKRNSSGLTQEDLAQKLNVTRQTISNWENGKRLPDIVMLNKIAKLYEISLDELCGDVTNKKQIYPKASDYLALLSCLMIIVYFIVGIATQHFKGDIALLMIITGLFMQAFIHLYFKNAITSENFTGIAGYDSKTEYNIPELKAMLIRLDTHLSCISTGSVMLYFVCAYLPEKLKYLPAGIMVVYTIDYIGACMFNSYCSSDRYLVHERDKKASRAGLISAIWYIVIVLAVCGTAVEQVMTHKFQNNTMASLAWCGWLFLLLIISTIELLLEQNRAKKLADKYKPGKSLLINTIICIVIIIIML